MHTLTRLISGAGGLLVLAMPAAARPPFLDTFRAVYRVAPDSSLSKAECLTCHAPSGPPARNPYGRAVQAALAASGSPEVTEAALRSVEPADSDTDAWGNGKEIASGTRPGDPADHPVGSPGGAPAARPTTTTDKLGSLVPPHTFHPLIVHFPIALFLFGGALQIAGARRGQPDLRSVGRLSVAVAAVAAVAAAFTGLAALLRVGFPLSGAPVIHLTLGSVTTATLLATALMARSAGRAGREPGSRLYWGVLATALALVSATGHIGALLVYGG